MAEKFALYASGEATTTERDALDHVVNEVCCFDSKTITEAVESIHPSFEGDYKIFKMTISVEVVKEGTK